MVLLYIALGLGITAIIAYFVVRDNKCKKNPLANIKFKDISLGEIEEKGMRLSQNNAVALKDGANSRLAKYISKIYKNIIKNHGFFDNVSKKNFNFSEEKKYILENVYLVQEAYDYIQNELSSADYFGLPSFNDGKPRIFYIASEFINDINGIIDEDRLEIFFKSFKDKFTMGELELLPASLMSALIERFNAVIETLSYSENGKKNRDKAEEDIGQSLSLDESLNKTESELIINIIKSFKFIDEYNWEKFFEEYSSSEKILIQDPSQIYGEMDLKSKIYYRKELQKLAHNLNIKEEEVAKAALNMSSSVESGYKKHIGYYIVDNGIVDIYNYFHKKYKKIKQKDRITVNIIYTAIFVIFFESFIMYTSKYKVGNKGILITAIMVILSLIPVSEIIFDVIQWIRNKFIKEKTFIPKMNFDIKIPKEYKTLAVMEAVIGNKDEAEKYIGNLEVCFLGNNERNLYYALIGSFNYNESDIITNNDDIIEFIIKRIKELNEKYGEKFVFLQCNENINSNENDFINERNMESKVKELSRFLKGELRSIYKASCNEEFLKGFKYVITLNENIQVTRGSLKKLIGAMAHPLNQLVVNDDKVARGYETMKLRLDINKEISCSTRFSSIFLPVHNKTISSFIYNDYDRANIIYDIDMLDCDKNEKSIYNIYKKCGSLEEFNLLKKYPLNYYMYSIDTYRNTLKNINSIYHMIKSDESNFIIRYDLLNEIRKDWVWISSLLLIVGAVIFRPSMFSLWITIAFITILTPGILALCDGIAELKFKERKETIYRSLLSLAFLPMEAYIRIESSVQYIIAKDKTSVPKPYWFSLKNHRDEGKIIFKFMVPSFAMAVIIDALAFWFQKSIFYFVFPVTALWILSPFIAYGLVDTIYKEKLKLEKKNINYFRNLSLKYWNCFEKEMANYKSGLNTELSSVSPEGIGSILMSNLCAYDMGYMGIEEFLQRLKNVIENMKSLESYGGHFFSRYNIKDLKPENPRYISTKESGVLLGYIIVLIEALKKIKEKPFLNKNFLKGLEDALVASESEDLSLSAFINKISLVNGIKEQYDLLDNISKECTNINDKNKYWISKVDEFCNKEREEIDRFIKFIFYSKDDYKLLETIIKNTSLKNLPSKLEEYLNSKELNSDLSFNMEASIKRISKLLCDIEYVQKYLNQVLRNTNFSMLYSLNKGLFSLGYNMEEKSLNNEYYDLLSSKSRLASFLAISKSEVSCSHWMNLKRNFINVSGNKTLVAEDDTIDEYFVPYLIMKPYKGTIWDESYKGASTTNTDITFVSLMSVAVNKDKSIKKLRSMKIEESIIKYENSIIDNVRCLMALDNILNDNILRKRFHNNPYVKAAESILQEQFRN